MERNQNTIAVINHQRAIRNKFQLAEKTSRFREPVILAVEDIL